MSIDIVVMADCASNYGVFEIEGSKAPTVYKVTFSGSEGPAHCTCKAWQFSKGDKHCKHVDQAWELACMYNPQWHEGKKRPRIRPVAYTYHEFLEERCLACGGPMVAVRRAV